MPKDDEYRDYALKSVELAKRANTVGDRSRLLVLAEAWLELAERTAKAARKRLRGAVSDDDKKSKLQEPK